MIRNLKIIKKKINSKMMHPKEIMVDTFSYLEKRKPRKECTFTKYFTEAITFRQLNAFVSKSTLRKLIRKYNVRHVSIFTPSDNALAHHVYTI